MKQRPSGCPARSGPGIFILVCALASVLLSSARSGAQQRLPATPAATASATAEARRAETQSALPAAPAQKREPGAAGPAQRAAQPGEEGAAVFREDNPGQRERWFYEQRAYPLGYIPFGIRQRAVESRDAMRGRERRLGIQPFRSLPARSAGAAPSQPLAIPANPLTWTPIGPQPTFNSVTGVQVTSGRVSAVAVDPTDANTVYIGGAQGGVWKTTDGGSNWTPLTDDQPSLAIGAIAIAPSNPQVIYVGTGEQTNSIGSYYGAGLLKSTNGGATWTHLPGQLTCGHADCAGPGVQPPSFLGPHSAGFSPGGGARISSIAVHPTNPDVLLAGVFIFRAVNGGASSGIYRSTDGGVSWSNVRPGAAGTEVFFDPADPQIAYGALGSVTGDPDNGIYKSTDGGLTWVKQVLPAPVSATNAARIEMAIAPSAPLTLYASVADAGSGSDHLLGMFKTTNGGLTWTSLGSGTPYSGTSSFCSPQCWYDHVLKVHPNDANVLYAGGAAVPHFFTRSTNGGASFTPAISGANGNTLHVDQHAMDFGFNGSQAVKLYVGNDGGVWSTDVSDPTAPLNWTNHNAALNITQFYPGMSIDPGDLDRAFGGTQDNGTQRYSGGLMWQWLPVCGDGGWTAMDPLNPATLYVSCQNIDLWKSQNGGATFSRVVSGITSTDPVQFIPPLVMDPSLPSRLYFGTDKVYQTVNGALSWTAISPAFSGELTTLAVAPGNSAVVYAGLTNGQVQVSSNVAAGSAIWTNRSSGLPNRVVRQIAVDPADAMKAFVSFSGFSGSGPNFTDTLGHVFRTADGGASWTDISSSFYSQTPLPNTPVNDLVIDPAIPGTLYAGTDVGMFATFDGGIHWQTLQSGFPNVAVLGLKLHAATRTLRAATHGRGMWDLQLPAPNAGFQITSLAPDTVTADPSGAGSFTLTVRGAGFTANSQILVDGSALPTNMSIAGSELQAVVPGSSLTVGTGISVAVSDPDPQKGISNGLPLTVQNPAPTLTNFSPASIAQGSSSFTLVVSGGGFLGTVGSAPITEVLWNGAVRNGNAVLTTPTTISVTIPANDVAAQGTAAISVRNRAPGGGTSVAQLFTILGPDFSVGVNPAAVTVTRGQASSAITVTVTPLNGLAFSGAVALSCTGLPSQSTCQFNPASVTPGTSPATATLTITTTAPGMAPPAGPQGMRWSPPPLALLALLLMAALLFAVALNTRAARRAPAWQQACYLLAIVILAGVFASCGGGGGGGGGPAPPPPNPGTPTGTFNVTVRGTSGAIQKNATLTLTVQ